MLSNGVAREIFWGKHTIVRQAKTLLALG